MSVLKCVPMSTELLNRITSNPRQCGGRPCIRGMRIRVKDVLDMLAGGASEEEILADFPYLEPDDIRASLDTPLPRSITRWSWFRSEFPGRRHLPPGLASDRLTSNRKRNERPFRMAGTALALCRSIAH